MMLASLAKQCALPEPALVLLLLPTEEPRFRTPGEGSEARGGLFRATSLFGVFLGFLLVSALLISCPPIPAPPHVSFSHVLVRFV